MKDSLFVLIITLLDLNVQDQAEETRYKKAKPAPLDFRIKILGPEMEQYKNAVNWESKGTQKEK